MGREACNSLQKCTQNCQLENSNRSGHLENQGNDGRILKYALIRGCGNVN